MEAATSQSINHQLYSLLCTRPRNHHLTISGFICHYIDDFASHVDISAGECRAVDILIGKTSKVFHLYQYQGITLGLTRPGPGEWIGDILLRVDGGRWILTRGPNWILREAYLIQEDGKIHIPTTDDELLALLDLVPTIVLISANDTMEVVLNTAPTPRDITFFPCDFPQSQPIALSIAFVERYCHGKYHEMKPGQRHTLAISSLTLAVAEMMYHIVDKYMEGTCRHGCSDCQDEECDRHLEQIAKLSPQEYVTFLMLMRELGIKSRYIVWP